MPAQGGPAAEERAAGGSPGKARRRRGGAAIGRASAAHSWAAGAPQPPCPSSKGRARCQTAQRRWARQTPARGSGAAAGRQGWKPGRRGGATLARPCEMASPDHRPTQQTYQPQRVGQVSLRHVQTDCCPPASGAQGAQQSWGRNASPSWHPAVSSPKRQPRAELPGRTLRTRRDARRVPLQARRGCIPLQAPARGCMRGAGRPAGGAASTHLVP